MPGGHRYARLALEPATVLEDLRGQTVLTFLDEQNLSKGARNHGLELDYRLLAERIRGAAKRVRLHLFTASADPDSPDVGMLRKHGYLVHTRAAREVRRSDGLIKPDINIDSLLAFWVGQLAVKTKAQVILLGSGDYALVGVLAAAIQVSRNGRGIAVMTLSLPGSTAQDLDARVNPHISANLEIGRDVLRPLY